MKCFFFLIVNNSSHEHPFSHEYRVSHEYPVSHETFSLLTFSAHSILRIRREHISVTSGLFFMSEKLIQHSRPYRKVNTT